MAAALGHGVRRVVHVSSNSPFGTNPHPGDTFRNDEPYHPYYGYGRSKMQAELRVLDAVDRGLDAVIVRPPWFYGPFQPARQTTFFRMVRTGRFPVIGDGQQRRSMAYVDNLVQGVVRGRAGADAGRAGLVDRRRPALHDRGDRGHGRPGARGRGHRREAQPPPPARPRRPRGRAGRRPDPAHRAATSRPSTCSARWTRPSPATSPSPARSSATTRRSRSRRACGAACAGAWSRGSTL